MDLRFIWDSAKATANLRKHDVSFQEAVTVFADPLARIHDDPLHSPRGATGIIVGRSFRGRLLLVSFAERRPAVRLISARRVTRHERHDYEKGTRV